MTASEDFIARLTAGDETAWDQWRAFMRKCAEESARLPNVPITLRQSPEVDRRPGDHS